MISLQMAQQLKDAGLPWTPQANDFFAVPERGMDERVFVMSEVMCYVEQRAGQTLVTFHGALEWALDYVLVTEALWLPRESQLRTHLEERLRAEQPPAVTLSATRDGYRCEIQHAQRHLAFEAFGAPDAYGQALLHLLRQGP